MNTIHEFDEWNMHEAEDGPGKGKKLVLTIIASTIKNMHEDRGSSAIMAEKIYDALIENGYKIKSKW